MTGDIRRRLLRLRRPAVATNMKIAKVELQNNQGRHLSTSTFGRRWTTSTMEATKQAGDEQADRQRVRPHADRGLSGLLPLRARDRLPAARPPVRGREVLQAEVRLAGHLTRFVEVVGTESEWTHLHDLEAELSLRRDTVPRPYPARQEHGLRRDENAKRLWGDPAQWRAASTTRRWPSRQRAGMLSKTRIACPSRLVLLLLY